jgi:hypothetical protein
MYSQVRRFETQSFFGTKHYCLTAQIHATQDELHLINHGRLGRIEVFHDPLREHFAAAAAAAHEKAKARGLFVTRARDATAVVGAELRTFIATYRALNAFNVTVADLLAGVTVEHKSLQAIMEIERAITECIDSVERFLRAARNYHDTTEDIFAPGTDEDPGVPPTQWPRLWRT